MVDPIYSATLKLLIPLEPEETMQSIVDQAIKLTGAKYGSIFMLVDGEIKRVYASSPKLYMIKPRKRGRTAKILKENSYFMSPYSELIKIRPDFEKLGIGSDLSVTLSSKGVNLGVLSVLSPKEKVFKDADLNLLKRFSPVATMALKKAFLHRNLEDVVKSRDLFISIASHELRTPMTTIYGYSQFIDKSVKKGQIPNQSHVDKLLSSERRMIKIIDELYQIHTIKLSSLQFKMMKENIIKIIKKAMDECSANYPFHKISFINQISQKDRFVDVDGDKMVQVVTNLLNNAAKFSDEGSQVRIKLEADGDEVVVSVVDRGIGIPAKEQPHIFTRFYKVNSKDRIASGMGLGLYLVKYIIEAHNGNIRVDSKPGVGTKMIFTLPKATG